MVFLHIDNSNKNTQGNDLVKQLDRLIGDIRNKVFLLFYMEGCGPCNATRPEWNKLKNVLSKKILNDSHIIIASIDYTLADGLINVVTKPASFPTIRYMANAGKIVENFEDSNIEDKTRTIDAFVKWIKHKTEVKKVDKPYKVGKTRRKWSKKYKKGINCRKPRGFSQRQYCKYGRKTRYSKVK